MRTIQLDVDFIGGQGPLTKEEEILLNEFFKKSKESSKKSIAKGKSKTKSTVRQQTIKQ